MATSYDNSNVMTSQKASSSGGIQPSSRKAETRGSLHEPHTASAMEGLSGKSVQRTIRIPLAFLPDKEWLELRKLAFQCSRYGNHLLTENYAKAKGLSGLTPYTDFQDVLSAAIRDAVGRECVGIWRRLGKPILRGEQTLARFSANRALVVRDRGISIHEDHLSLRLHPKNQAEKTVLPYYMPAIEKDWYIADTLAKLQSGEYRVSKASIKFKRPGRKVFVLLSYEKALIIKPPAERKAHLKVNEYGELWLKHEDKALSLTHTVERLKTMKRNFRGIHARLRRALKGKPRNKALLKVGSYEAWSGGVIHQLTAEIISWCQTQQCGNLLIFFPKVSAEERQHTIAWAEIASTLKYKCEEHSINFELHEFSDLNATPAKELEKFKTEVSHVAAVSLG
jgi:hypothetical protein